MAMEPHLYLSVMPEALIASHLNPEQFGTYYATGSQKKSRSMAMFFELDNDYRHEYFDMETGFARLVPHEDGSPKRSVYISVYRVVEHVAPSAVKKLYLTTADGRTLGLDAADQAPECEDVMHLYQEIAPVHPRVVSSLCPADFYDFLYDPSKSMVTVPALCFVELTLGGLAEDPEFGSSQGLPYTDLDHYRQCLLELSEVSKTAPVKIVDRIHKSEFHYRTIKSGCYLGSGPDLLYFPMPTLEQLRTDYYQWWRSAQM
jgi:hypothetical protein